MIRNIFSVLLICAAAFCAESAWERACAAGDTLSTNALRGFPCRCVVSNNYCVMGATVDTVNVAYYVRVSERQYYVNPVVGRGFWTDECKEIRNE